MWCRGAQKKEKLRGKGVLCDSKSGAKFLLTVFLEVPRSLEFQMEAVKLVALLVVVVAVQVFGALGFSSDEEDGEVWMVQNWKVKKKKKEKHEIKVKMK